MRKLIIILSLLAIAKSAIAATDYNCMNRCLKTGDSYQMCLQECGY